MAKFITPKQASKDFGVSQANLARRRYLRKQPTYYKRGKCVLYKTEEVERWVLEGKVAPSGM